MVSVSDLPFEVKTLIVSYIKSQHDLLSLCLVDGQFHDLSRSRLYSSITLDCGVNTFDKEYDDLVEIQGFTTYIKRTKSMLKLVDKLNTDEKYSRLVHSLKLIETPNDYYTVEKNFLQIVPKLTGLRVLDLIPLEIDCRILNKLNSKSLNCLKLTFSGMLSRQHPMKEQQRSIVQSLKPMETDFQLNTLALNNVADAAEFDHFFKILVADSSKLKNLQVTKYDHPEYGSINPLNGGTPDRLKIFPILDIKHLKSFTLVNHIFTSNDAWFLPHLKHLESLTLLKVSEMVTPTQVSIFDQQSDLQFDKLTHLRIQIGSSLIESFGEFLANCQTPRLTNLVIDLDYNETSGLVYPFELYIEKIQSLRNELITLSFVTNSNRATGIDRENLMEMFSCRYPKLRNLTFAASYHRFTDLKPDYMEDGNVSLPSLEVFCLLGETTRSRNFASGTAFPGVYDDWFRIQHIPKGLMEEYFGSPSKVKYIKIDKRPFEIIRPKVQMGDKFTVVAEPRHTLNQWLDLKTGRNQVYSEKF